MNYESAWSLGLIVLLLTANAFFVAAEFALVKARGARIDSLANEGSFAAKLTSKIQANLESYLAACQLGITMASLGLGWVGEPAVAAVLEPLLVPLGFSGHALHTISFLLGFIIFSSLHIVVGEQVPKTYAIRNPEPVSIWCAIPLRLFYVLLFPLTWLLNWASRAILTLMGVDEAPHTEVLTGTEIRSIVDTSAEHGHLGEDQALMIQNLFRFDERTVGRVMVPRVDCDVINLDDPMPKIVAVMKETQHSRFPVVKNKPEELVGIVLMKELMDAVLGGEAEPWSDLRSYCREPLVVPESIKVARMFDIMREDKRHMACIVDEYGVFVGVVTMEDLLEEIVGEISDETDDELPHAFIEQVDKGWHASGLMSLTDAERETGFHVADNLKANTLSGLFMTRLERMPQVGDSITEFNYRLTVEAVVDRHVESVLIESISAGPELDAEDRKH